jgi:hypothetical protein
MQNWITKKVSAFYLQRRHCRLKLVQAMEWSKSSKMDGFEKVFFAGLARIVMEIPKIQGVPHGGVKIWYGNFNTL